MAGRLGAASPAGDAPQGGERRRGRFFDEAPIGLFSSTVDGRILAMNSAARAIAGLPEDRPLTGMRVTDQYTDPRERAPLIDRLLREGIVPDHVFSGRRGDGGEAWLETSEKLVRDADGRPLRIESSIRDVTARHLAEEAARHRLHELEALEKTAEDLIRHLDLFTVLDAIVDRTSTLLDAPDAFITLIEPDEEVGITRIGRGVFEAFLGLRVGKGEHAAGRAWEERRSIVVNDYQAWPDAIAEVTAGGVQALAATPLIVNDRVVGLIGLARHESGRSFQPADVAVLERFSHLAMLGLESGRLFQAAAAVEARFRALVEQIPAIVYLDRVTPKVETMYVSPQVERILGFRPEEWLGDPERWLAAVHPDERASVREEYFDPATLDRATGLEYRMIARDGRVVWIRDEWASIRDEDGRPREVQGLMFDVTARRTLEEQLRQAQKMEAVGQLAGGIAHDFNNLLTAMRGYAELLVANLGMDDPRRHDAIEIQRAAERASTLTGQLLAFGRRQIVHPRVIELDRTVAGIESLLRRLIGADVEILVRTGAAHATIQADPSQLEQVIVNLAVNARDAMPGGGRLVIATRCETGSDGKPWAALEVTDTGTGMDAGTQARIFEPFFTTKEHGKGTGLGLATVYGVVQQCGATIDVRTAPGEGTTVVIRFPESPAPGVGADPAPPEPAATGHGTVLVAEDEPAVRDLVVSLLLSAGYHVLLGRDAAQALALAEDASVPIDLLLTDVVMPGMNGRVLAERLLAAKPSARVIYMSGYPLGAEISAAEGPFLQKPFARQELLRAVQSVLGA